VVRHTERQVYAFIMEVSHREQSVNHDCDHKLLGKNYPKVGTQRILLEEDCLQSPKSEANMCLMLKRVKVPLDKQIKSHVGLKCRLLGPSSCRSNVMDSVSYFLSANIRTTTQPYMMDNYLGNFKKTSTTQYGVLLMLIISPCGPKRKSSCVGVSF
jgi:hypothetical protein